MWHEKSFNTLEMLPDFFKDTLDFKALCSIYDDELLEFVKHYKEALDDFFIETASSKVIDKYCYLFKINIDENKRDNLISKLSEIPPYDINSLNAFIDRITGGKCEIEILSDFLIKISYTSQFIGVDTSLILKEVYNILPANIKIFLIYKFLEYSQVIFYRYSKFKSVNWLSLKYNKF